MKSFKQHLQLLFLPSKPSFSLFFLQSSLASLPFSSSSSPSSSSSLSETTITNPTLTQDELSKINLLIPRLCLTNHFPTALHLLHTCLLTNPPLKSLPLPVFIDSLTSQPDMIQSMAFLNQLKHSPRTHHYLTSINFMLIASYFEKDKPKEALKVLNWMIRPGSPCKPDRKIYEVLISGFCKKSMIFEAVKVLRAMIGSDLVPEREIRDWVYKGLLREARVRESMNLNKALDFVGGDADKDSDGAKKVLVLLDQMITNWTE